MRTMRLAVTCALALVGTAEARNVRDHRSPSTGGGAHTLSVGPVFEMKVTLLAWQRITCRTQNPSPGADPVLHLLAFSNANGPAVEKARDDDSGGGFDAHLTFRAEVPGTYRLVMRASWEGGRGTADLFCDDRPVAFRLPVGGAFKRMESMRNRETLVTVPLPAAPRGHVVYFLDDGQRLLERHASGNNESVVRALGARPTHNALVASLYPDITGPIRLIRNDNLIDGHDSDRDGLGNELEKQIGTCSSRNEVVGNWDCGRSTDARDTDGDGLRDDLELMGLFTPSEPYQLLPRWGANPLHKDIFIEVDSMARSHTDPPHILTRDNALKLAGIYGDAETDPLLRLLHAQQLGNPDLQPGIRVHLDTGVRPADGAPAMEHVTFGDWGGHTVVPPVCDGDDCHGADGPTVWREHMHRHRFGIFHYALGDAASGGQAPVHSVALNMPVGSPNTAAHELGHTLGLDHNGPFHEGPDANCKPNYPSLMSYSYLGVAAAAVPDTFSDGQGRAPLDNVALDERGTVSPPTTTAGKRYLQDLMNVYGFNVDLAAGDVDWNRDGVISDGPVRAYANDNGQCEFTRVNSMRSKGLSSGAITLTRLGNRTIILYSDERDRRIWMDFTTDDLSCPDLTEDGCGSALTRRAVNEPWNRSIVALDAHPVAVNGERRLLVVFRARGGLFETLLSPDLTWTAPQHIRTTFVQFGEISLTGDDDHTILAFKNQQRVVTTMERSSASGAWGADQVALDLTGAEIGRLPGNASPGILEVTRRDGTRVLYGAFPLSDRGTLVLYERDPATGRWKQDPFAFPDERAMGRPALAFEPVEASARIPFRLHLLYLQQGTDDNHVVRRATLVAKGLGPLVQMALVPKDHDNGFFYGKGVDLLFEPQVDSNLRAVVATAVVEKGVPQPHVIQLRPKADGIVAFKQKNANDWEALGVELCATLRSAGATVDCPAFPF